MDVMGAALVAGTMNAAWRGPQSEEKEMGVQFTLQGRVKPDGTLELDEKVPMPEGQVLVTIQPVFQPPPDDPFWQRMEAIWADQRARGHVPRTKEEIDGELRSFSQDADAEIQVAVDLHEECQRARSRGEPRPEKAE
jgi:hypothetical protein